jgi:hypothetical protein
MALNPLVTKDGNGSAANVGAFRDQNSVAYPGYTVDNSMSTYRASANFTPTATSALTVAALKGSASATIRVTKICIGGVSTALSASIFKLIRVSALGAGGTVVTPTVAKLDTGSPAATGIFEVYTTTAKASDTTAEGSLAHFPVFTTTVTTPTVAYVKQGVVFPEEGSPAGQSLVLRGTSEILAITNVAPANLGAGTVLCISIEWREDAS